MHPILFTLFGFPVKAYGFFLTLAHLAGMGAVFLLARRRGLSVAPLIDLFFVCIVTGLLGARALYAFSHWSEFSANPATLLQLEQGGLSLFGGFIPAFFAAIFLLRWKKLPVLAYADALCPALPFSIALIRLGCFAQGCCYGAPAQVSWAVIYSRLDSKVPPALLDRALHPTQLYEASFLFALAALTAWLGGKKLKVPGLLGTFTVFAYCAFRFFIDFHRGDLERDYLGVEWLTLSQLGAIAGMLASPAVAWLCFRALRPSSLPAP